MDTDIIEAESRDIAVAEARPQGMVTLFGTDDPTAVIERASKTASALMDVVSKQKLSAQISGRKHLLVEAWTLLGSMLGVYPVVVWTRPIKQGDIILGWEARVEARTRDGGVVGSAESMCMRSENTWKNRDEFAIRSMAQTRATSKALATPLRFVAVLAGFAGTPAEEMPSAGASGPMELEPGERPFREGDLCPECAAGGFVSSRGKPAAYFIPSKGPRAGVLQCNGRDGERWMNHSAPLSGPELHIVDDSPIPF